MPSGSEPRGWSVRARVAATAAVVGALAALGAAGGAAVLVDDLARASEERRLLDAATVAHRELSDAGREIAAAIEDEVAEVAPLGLRMAVFANGQRLGGAADVAYLDTERCGLRDAPTGPVRACAVGGVERRVVVSTAASLPRRGWSFGFAIAFAAASTALLSALLSGLLSRWALAPLTKLTERVSAVSSETPAETDLGGTSGAAEVELLRGAIVDLLSRLGGELERSRAFASSAAHELRTPIASVMAEIDLAIECRPEDVRSALRRARRTLDRLSVLVERLLAVAAGPVHSALTGEAVAMGDLVTEAIADRSPGERARVHQEGSAEGMVRGDPTLLRTTVDNLLDNALKFSRDRPVSLRVMETEVEVLVAVDDEGPGIDPSESDRLLRAFERGAAVTSPGVGLGLFIAAHAARVHSGCIRFEKLGRGTRVLLVLPAWAPESETKPPPTGST